MLPGVRRNAARRKVRKEARKQFFAQTARRGSAQNGPNEAAQLIEVRDAAGLGRRISLACFPLSLSLCISLHILCASLCLQGLRSNLALCFARLLRPKTSGALKKPPPGRPDWLGVTIQVVHAQL